MAVIDHGPRPQPERDPPVPAGLAIGRQLTSHINVRKMRHRGGAGLAGHVAIVGRCSTQPKLSAATPGALRAVQDFSLAAAPAAAGVELKRRAMSSTGRSSQMKPHLPWVTLTSTAVVIPMPASTAIRGGAKRRDSGRGWALEERRPGPGCGPGGGKIGQQIPELAPGSRGQGPPVRSSNSPAVSLPAWKCSLRSDTTASRSESEALISAGR